MVYFNAFIFCGIVCGISQIIMEKTKLTPGHINTALVIIGCALSGFGIYDKIIDFAHAGATVPIINFGHLLVTGAYEGFVESGFIGLFKGVLVNASAGLSVAIFIAFAVSLVCKPKH